MEIATEGHNVLILGPAGTGKSYVVKKIAQTMKSSGKRVGITGTTGMAASLIQGVTVHKFFALRDGRYSNEELTIKIMTDVNYHDVKTRILSIDCVIIDEISMLSWKLLEQIEYVCRNVRGVNKPFGGIQMVLAGDFFQLKPVANQRYGDPGDLVISNRKFRDLIPHHIVLKKVYRQSEEKLITAIHELSRGLASESTIEFLKTLERPLVTGVPVRLFSQNYDVDICNSDNLLELTGESVEYKSTDGGDNKQLTSCEAPSYLYLKVNAPVILTVNLSDKLVNGSRGKVKELKKDSVMVYFDNIASTIEIQKHLFTVYDIQVKRDVATRLQIPLRLGYAFTVHKAQGLTLDCVEVDCRNMNFPGQLGVAIGRATRTEGLRVINFNKCFLKKQPNIIASFYESQSAPLLQSKECCAQPIHTEDAKILEYDVSTLSRVTENWSESDSFDEDSDVDDSLQTLQVEDLPAEFPIQNLPEDIDLDRIIRTDIYSCPQTQNQVLLNTDLNYLLTHFEDTSTFAKQIWKSFTDVFNSSIPDDKSVGNKHLTKYHKDVVHFLSKDTYKKMVAKLFSITEVQVSSRHFRAAFSLVEELRKRVVMQATETFIRQSEQNAAHDQESKQFKSSEGGRAKVRYIAGWCVASLKHNKKKQVKRNLYKKNARGTVTLVDQEVKCLEELVVTQEEIFQSTTDVSSLMEVKRKQNVRQGLTNVTDSCFEFFLELDKQIRKMETIKNIHIYSKQLYTFILSEINESQHLKEMWKALFNNAEGRDGIVMTLFDQIVNKYVKMSSNQFKKECNRTFAVEKEQAHRKQILKKKEKAAAYGGHWNMENIYNDKSTDKISSHRFIQCQIEANNKYLINGPFQKKHLLILCAAYGITTAKNITKQDLSDTLKSVILSSDKMVNPDAFHSDEDKPGQSISSKSKEAGVSSENISNSKHAEEVTTDQVSTQESASGSKNKRIRQSTKSKGKRLAKKARTIHWPCGICEQECFEEAVCCDNCDTWHHFHCLFIDKDDDQLKSEQWMCPNCRENECYDMK